jgi:uncharacterized protein YlxW (UPF0749 family)
MTEPATDPPTRRRDGSMTLITEVMTRPLDPGYATAAQRRQVLALARADAGEPPQPARGVRGRSPLALVVLAVVGLLMATAFLQARQARPASVVGREQLVAEITRRDAAATALQQSNARLAATVEAIRARTLTAQSQGGLAAQVAQLGLVTGAVEVTGPGIVVTMDDAAAAVAGSGSNPRADQQNGNGRVLDADVQLVVNGLWGAGAEAIAINGQRLTSLSAIRSAGQAILVDYRPLAPPYLISAIGDPATLPARFGNGAGARDLQYLKDNFGVRYDVTGAKSLMLPASSSLSTRRAAPLGRTPVGGGAPTPSSTPDAPRTPLSKETP